MVFIREFAIPTEGVRISKENVQAQVGQNLLGKGTLYVAENAISWVNSATSEEGFRILYPDMVLHAVSRDRDLCPSDCIYVMVNQQLQAANTTDSDGNEADLDPDPEEEMTEIRFIPEDATNLQDLYNVISECNLLHDPPASNSSDDVEEEPGDIGLYDEDMEEGDDEDERLAMFNRMNIHFGNGGSNGDGNGHASTPPEEYDPDQFEDAD